MPVGVSQRLQCLHSSTALRTATRKELRDNCRFCVSSGYYHPRQTLVNRVSHRLRYLESGTVPMASPRKKWIMGDDCKLIISSAMSHRPQYLYDTSMSKTTPPKETAEPLADLTSTPCPLTGTTARELLRSRRYLLTQHRRGPYSNRIIIQILSSISYQPKPSSLTK
jgi:hypothetical protein